MNDMQSASRASIECISWNLLLVFWWTFPKTSSPDCFHEVLDMGDISVISARSKPLLNMLRCSSRYVSLCCRHSHRTKAAIGGTGHCPLQPLPQQTGVAGWFQRACRDVLRQPWRSP
jgi:hypothetical protein